MWRLSGALSLTVVLILLLCSVPPPPPRWNRLRAPGDKTKWTTLEHNGILFPAEYAAHGKPLVYDGVEMVLPADAEEVATMWATMLDTAADFCKNPTFAKNFFRDFKATLPKDTPIKEMAKCDFEIMRVFLTRERETAKLLKKTMDKEAKAREKKEKDLLQNTYGYALVDGYKEKVGNFKVEPPNLFRGRGNHPKTGTLKRRVKPEDIIINISPGMPIPKPPVGHKWRGIIHNNRVTWLAFYRDNVNGDFKYIWLAPSSRFKGESDIKKVRRRQTTTRTCARGRHWGPRQAGRSCLAPCSFSGLLCSFRAGRAPSSLVPQYTKAQKLKNYISDIRKNYKKEMESAHSQFRQRATAIYLIDFLALRVGNEKDASEVADTVGSATNHTEDAAATARAAGSEDTVALDPADLGALVRLCFLCRVSCACLSVVSCCSLRVEHLTFTPPNKVTFDFLGKDSMRYYNTVELDQQAYKNLESFTFKKKPKDEVFDNLTTTLLNEHLKSLMPELTAKVFRTYNASITLEAELRSKEVDRHEHVTQKVNFYNAANRAVAILCNHQRTVPKGHEAAVGKLREQIEALKDDREEIEDWIAEEEGGKKAKKEDKAARGAREEARAERRQARLDKVRAELRTKYEKAKADRVALRAAGKEVESEDEPEEKQEKTKSRPTGQTPNPTATAAGRGRRARVLICLVCVSPLSSVSRPSEGADEAERAHRQLRGEAVAARREQGGRARHVEDQLHGPAHHRRLVQGEGGAARARVQSIARHQVPVRQQRGQRAPDRCG